VLTYDDSPSRFTTNLLTKLDRHNLRAFFFCIGRNAAASPRLIREIAAAGHSLGNHSFTHSNMRQMSEQEQYSDLKRADDALGELAGEKPLFFRPPYGKFNFRLLRTCKEMGLHPVLWSLLTYDYKNDLKTVKFAMKYLRRNSIIVFHDSPKCSDIMDAIPDILLEEVAKRNFKIGEPSECLRMN
jgi:peptidoglycan/xylan/chitin deacetylase (PgdA/CDA1 family)